MSAFWNFVTRFVPGNLAKAEEVNTNLDGVNTGFNLVEAEINKAIQITDSPGVTDIGLNAAARANKLLAFDVNGDIAASQTLGDWKGNHADAAGTDYEIRDVVKDAAGSIGQDNLYICNNSHTSTGGLATDVANWDLLVEVSGVAASAAAALVSENNAATSADFLDDRVLGSFSTANEPALDNDGNALLTGAQYFNTDLNRMKVYTGSAWQLNTAAAADVTIADAGTIYTAVEVEAALQEVKLLADTNKTNADASKVKTDFITVTQAVDLDIIESDTVTNNAKLTANTANVTSAGALMDSEVDADIKTLSLPASTTISAFGRTLIDDAAASNARTTLGLGILAALNGVGQGQVNASAIGQGELKTTTASGSVFVGQGGSVNYTLAGGTYSWWTAGASGVSKPIGFGSANTAAGIIGMTTDDLGGGTIYFDERYVQASPPYNNSPLFVFLLINNNTQEIQGSYIAEDPPWAHNGPNNISPQYKRDGKSYRKIKKVNGINISEIHNHTNLLIALENGDAIIEEKEIEITVDHKDIDQAIIPHPFPSANLTDQTIVMLEPTTKLMELGFTFCQDGNARGFRDIALNNYLTIDKTPIHIPHKHDSVTCVKAKMKLTRGK